MSKPRVLIFSQNFIGNGLPGLQSKLFDEYLTMSKKIKLVIITSKIKKNNYDNIKIIKSPSLKLPLFPQKFLRSLSFLLSSIKVRNDYEIIFIRMLTPVHLLPAVVLTFFFKKKLIVWFSGSSNIRQGKIKKKIVQLGLNSAERIGFNNEDQIRVVESLGVKIDKNKVFYIKPGVDLSKFKSERNENTNKIILNVSRINPDKRIEDSIKVIPFLIEKFPDLKFKIVGHFENKNYLKNLKDLVSKLNCKNFIEFVGPVPHNTLNSTYNSAKVFLFTSKHEGAPGVILEAMACGLPVISTPVGIIPQLIKDGVNGFLIKKRDPKIIAEKISLLLTDEELRNEIGLAARETIGTEYSLDTFIDNLIYYFKN